MNKDYHPYVFDKNKFVGKFEEMYQNESTDYDSWFQSDLRDYGYLMSFAILSKYNFSRILDIGCGKGLFTSLLKKANNTVVAIDGSQTAIMKARASFKDIDFQCFTVDKDGFNEIKNVYKEKFDLILFKEVLSYMKDWKQILKDSSAYTTYVFISLDLPDKPIGFVKSFRDLRREVKKYYDIIVEVPIKTTGKQLLILGVVRE